LDIVGLVAIVVFAGLLWWPAAVGAFGLCCLLLSWSMNRRRP
jgi:hypothetical protein